MREERAQRRTRAGSVSMDIQGAERSGKIVIEAENVSFEYDGRRIVRDLSTTILRGDKIGIIGPNGSGKTTLLRLLLGELQPTRGTLKLGTNLQIAYFDQYRAALDEEKSVLDNVGDGSDTVTINGQPKHVLSYLQDFLFAPNRARQPVKALSGGERNRLLLAKLFTKPSNLLVLDEPTNDLDSDTLDLLEELLSDYKGTVLLVSHDRAFLNNVVTSTLVFEGDGVVNDYVGGYDDWLRQRFAPTPGKQAEKPAAAKPAPSEKAPAKQKKLSFKDQRELEMLPQKIQELETEREQINVRMSEPAFYQQEKSVISAAQQRLAEIDTELGKAYARWEALEALAG
jgi:ATP-binding cassette subfamily F protein uup